LAGKRVVITADDFGLAPEVNAAVESAHTQGVLSAASLMVAADAATDAVACAARLPRLGVGLHLVLVEGRPTLPAKRIPDLVDSRGRLRSDMVRFGIDIVRSQRVRAQLAAEIEAQFEAFRATGLVLDHVNAHKHFHLHPVVSSLTLSIGRRYGLRALRVPYEPRERVDRVDDADATAPALPRLWVALLRRRAQRAALRSAVHTFGNAFSGGMTTPRLLRTVDRLTAGISEIYLHPATSDRFPGAVSGYRYGDELAALLSPDVASRLRAAGIAPCRFADLPTA